MELVSRVTLPTGLGKVKLPPTIYVIVPAINEAQSVGEVVKRTDRTLAGFDREIVVVDGFSNDDTAQIAKRLGATVLMEKAHGYGAAYMTGFEYAMSKSTDFIAVMIDGDSTYEPADITALIEPILEGKADITLANRFTQMDPGAMSFRNRIANKIISTIVSVLYGLKIQDSQSGFRAISASCLRGMYLEANGMPLATEMIIEARKLGARVLEIPSRYKKRIGESKIRALHDGYGILWTSLRLVSELNPFLIYGSLGALFFSLGVGFGAYALVGWYQWHFLGANTWPRLGSALLSVLFIVGGTVVFGLGILLDSLLRYLKAVAYREKIALRNN